MPTTDYKTAQLSQTASADVHVLLTVDPVSNMVVTRSHVSRGTLRAWKNGFTFGMSAAMRLACNNKEW
jgi:hypothetical protein